MLCSLFIFHTTLNEPIECEISLSNKASLSQSDLIQMFFISYDTYAFTFWKWNKHAFISLFNALVLKNMVTNLDHDF